MITKPLFSVLVANYNNGSFLNELVDSLKAQSFQEWEIVIVDDCSTDDSRNYLEVFSKDSRVTVVYHDKNKGAAAAFSSAANNAASPFCGLLGADDALHPDALEKMYSAHRMYPDASLIYSDYYICDFALNKLGRSGWVKAIPDGESIINQRTVSNFVTFKKESYDKTEGFDSELRRAVDQDLYFKLEEVGKVVYIDEPLYLYRSNPNGISQLGSSSKALLWEYIAVLKAVKRRSETKHIFRSLFTFKQTLKQIYYFLAGYMLNWNSLNSDRGRLGLSFISILKKMLF
ncbi:glycosyltransferase [Leptospira sp. WS92.C1]